MSEAQELTERYPESVLSGLTVEEIANLPAEARGAPRAPRGPRGAARRGAAPRSSPSCWPPWPSSPFSGTDWLFEIKYDGVRVLASRAGTTGRRSTAGAARSITARYPEVVRALRALAGRRTFVIDGEIVALDDGGRPSFQRLQPRMAAHRTRATSSGRRPGPGQPGCSSTASTLDGHDLRRLPLVERKDCLRLLLPPLGRRLLRRPRPRARRRPSSRRPPSSGSRGSWRRGEEPLRRRALPRLAQDQVPAPAGVRDRRLHRSPGLARATSARCTSALYEGPGDPARLRLKGRHRIRRGQAQEQCGRSSTRSARATSARSTSGDSDRPRPPLGGAQARLRGALHASGPRTAGSAIRRSSGCGTTSKPEECRREMPDCRPEDWTPPNPDACPLPRGRSSGQDGRSSSPT